MRQERGKKSMQILVYRFKARMAITLMVDARGLGEGLRSLLQQSFNGDFFSRPGRLQILSEKERRRVNLITIQYRKRQVGQ